MNREKYPVFIKQDMSHKGNPSWLVYVPDLNVYTEGFDYEDAKKMAIDIIEVVIKTNTSLSNETPVPSDMERALQKAKENADETFDYSDGECVFL